MSAVLLRWCSAIGFALLAPLATAADINPDCDAPGFQRVLQSRPAASAPMAARAYWLNGRLIQWPGLGAAQGSFRLHASSRGQIEATVGQTLRGAELSIELTPSDQPLEPSLQTRFKFVAPGVRLALSPQDAAQVPRMLQQQVVLALHATDGRVLQATGIQLPGALDDLYAGATKVNDLGATLIGKGLARTNFKLWAPTAQQVSLCLYPSRQGPASQSLSMTRDNASGVWAAAPSASLSSHYYTYLVDVQVPGVGLVRNRVTDPYSVSLTTDSQRSMVADLDAKALQPPGWGPRSGRNRAIANTDMAIYELHVRDFSINDLTVPQAHRGKYLAFIDTHSNGMRHLRTLARAGITDIHLLPVFDIATIPEQGCVTPPVPHAWPDSEAQQTAVMAHAGDDCFNWGYDPFHYSAPEGSYATNAADGARRIIEFRAMVQALHRAGLRVGMDMVYNHTTSSGQTRHSVLDRIVPGYYHRLNDEGVVERSTCCDNTATEHPMMGKLLIESVLHWARHYDLDSFRFDLMAHQPKSVMLELQQRLDQMAGRHINLIGEGWNFGEVASGARFEQASQLSLNGTGIGTFSDRGRDAIRGGSAGDSGEALVKNQGYINGLIYDPNVLADPRRPQQDLLRSADMVRVALAGSVRSYAFTDHLGQMQRLEQVDYGGGPAGYVAEPSEVVNYVENHDNQTLFDINAYRLPLNTSHEDRVRVQMLGVALTAFSQGMAYFHAGIDILRSKSLDGNSFDSGDWFNRLDWSYQDNYFGTGAPPANDNKANYPWLKPLLTNALIKPRPQDIALARDMFGDLLRVRVSSSLFRLRTTQDIIQRLHFYNTGPQQIATLQVGHLDGRGYPGAHFKEVLYVVNVDTHAQTLMLPEQAGKAYALHPVQRRGADTRLRTQARFDAASGTLSVPARSAVVFVVK